MVEILNEVCVMLAIGSGLGGLLIIASIASAVAEVVKAWICDDMDSEYSNWFEGKVKDITGQEFGVVGILVILSPLGIYIALALYPLTLFVAVSFALAHLARFAIRLSTKFNSHADDKNIHKREE